MTLFTAFSPRERFLPFCDMSIFVVRWPTILMRVPPNAIYQLWHLIFYRLRPGHSSPGVWMSVTQRLISI